MHQLGPGSHKSCYIRTHLWSSFCVTLGLAGSINRKMVLVNLVWDRKLNLGHEFRILEKIITPYYQPCLGKPKLTIVRGASNGVEPFLHFKWLLICISNGRIFKTENDYHYSFKRTFLVLWTLNWCKIELKCFNDQIIVHWTLDCCNIVIFLLHKHWTKIVRTGTKFSFQRWVAHFSPSNNSWSTVHWSADRTCFCSFAF